MRKGKKTIPFIEANMKLNQRGEGGQSQQTEQMALPVVASPSLSARCKNKNLC